MATEIETTEPETDVEAPPAFKTVSPRIRNLKLRRRDEEASQDPPSSNPFGEPIKTAHGSDEPDTPTRGEHGTGTKTMRAFRESEDKSVVDWLKSLESDAPIRVVVYRTEPKEVFDPVTGQRKKVDGLLRRYDRAVDEEELQRNHGGGTLKLRVNRQDARGSYTYLAGRTIELAGDPRLDDVPRTAMPTTKEAPPAAKPSDDPIFGKLVDNLIRGQNAPAPDVTGHIQAAMAPLLESNRRLEEALARKDQQLADLITRKDEQIEEIRKGDPHENTFREQLLNKFIDGDTARLQAVRMQYESEIRQIKEAAIENEKRVRDQSERDRERDNRAHERELNSLKSSYDTKVAAIEQSFAIQKTVLETENRRLERELGEIRVDLKELRNKKDPSLKDKISEIRDFKDIIGDLGDDDDKDDKKSGIVKFLEGAAQSEVIGGFVQRVVSGGGGQPQQPQIVEAQQQQRAQPQRQRGGPRLVRDRRNGQVYATDGQKAIPVKRKRPIAAPQQPVAVAPIPPPMVEQVVVDEHGNQVIVTTEVPPVVEQPEQQPPQVPEAVEIPIPYVDPQNVAMAIQYMTNAYQNSVDPQTFVDSVRVFIPKEIISTIAAMPTVEEFLTKVGGLDTSSPLMSQRGRSWARKAARYLVGE